MIDKGPLMGGKYIVIYQAMFKNGEKVAISAVWYKYCDLGIITPFGQNNLN